MITASEFVAVIYEVFAVTVCLATVAAIVRRSNP